MPDAAQLASFYDSAYSEPAAAAAEHSRWRALGASGKADHVLALCARGGLRPASTIDVGCGDGALLCELARRGFGGRLTGAEISQAAVAIARQRSQIERVLQFDGQRLPAEPASYELAIASHVLEHVPDPAALLREIARVSERVVVEVPLEANLSARRAGRRAHASQIGHLQRFDRNAARAIVAQAGLSVVAELSDALPRPVHVFFARGALQRARGTAKWLLRTAVHASAPALARRLFTVHYACLCQPAG